MNHHICKIHVVSFLTATLLFLAASGTYGEEPCQKPQIKADGEYIEETVVEGVGFAGLVFGDTKEYAEVILGDPTGGCSWLRKFMNNRVTINYCNNSAGGFHFFEGFKGTLSKSGIGIGHTLDHVVYAYGEYKEERKVKFLHNWYMDRVLFIVKEEKESHGKGFAKIQYIEEGVYFVFNKEYEIIEFGLTHAIDAEKDKSDE